jgi:tetratricopeptide (TPR) repeat protein
LAIFAAAFFWWDARRPENCYRRGRRALEAGDRQTVLRESRRLIALPEFEPQGRLLFGLLLAHSGQPAEALPQLQRAAQAESIAVEALTAGAECYYALGRYREAVETARAALARDDAALDARRWLAAAYYDLGASVNAAAELERLSAQAPNDPRPERLLALIDKDNEAFAQAVGHYRESLKRDPDQFERSAIRLELAESLVKLGRFDEARETLRDDDRTPAALTLAARCEQSLGRIGQAEDLLRKALAIDPSDLSANLLLGTLLLSEGRADEAARALEEAAARAPYSSQAHFYLSQVYARRGKKDQAAAQVALMHETQAVEREFSDLHQTASQSPFDADVRYRLGVLAGRLGKPDLARMWFRSVLALDPGHTEARTALEE